tara:strand:+ start:271 stop:1281 length:1011 start_codon:yes stop_codon:yes gene_type:complete
MKRKSSYFKDHPYNLFESVANSPFPLPTNSQGFIGKEEYKKLKKGNIYRILVLGTSPIGRLPPPSQNKNNDPNLTITHLIQNKLNERNSKIGSDKRYEVLNLATTAYNSYECLIAYICKGIYFQPDLIVSYQGVNDVIWSIMANNFTFDYSHSRKNNFSKKECLINNLFCALPDSKFIDFIDKVFLRFNLKKPNGLIFSISNDNLSIDRKYSRKKLNPFFNNIEMLNSLAESKNIKLLNLSFLWDINRPANPSHFYKQLRYPEYRKIFNNHYNRYLTELNNTLIRKKNLNTFELDKKEFKSSCFFDGLHFSLEGMEIFSSLVSDYISKNQKYLFNK